MKSEKQNINKKKKVNGAVERERERESSVSSPMMSKIFATTCWCGKSKLPIFYLSAMCWCK